MSPASIIALSAAAVLAAALVLRELWLRLAHRYDYRWETFAVRGLGGRLLLHLRRAEIVSVERLGPRERLAGIARFRQLSRSGFGPKVLIRTNIARAKPVVVSWEGRAIAGLAPEGLKLRPDGRKG